MADDLRSLFDSAIEHIPVPQSSPQESLRRGARRRLRRRVAFSTFALAGVVGVSALAITNTRPATDGVGPVSPPSTPQPQPTYPSGEGWPQVTFVDPQGPWVEPNRGERKYMEGPREIVTSGTVTYEGETTRWSYTLFRVAEGSEQHLPVDEFGNPTLKPGDVCAEDFNLYVDDSGGGSIECGLQALVGEDRKRDLMSAGGVFSFEDPVVGEHGAVSVDVARLDLEFPSGETHQIPIHEGPSGYDINVYVLFLADVEEPALLIAYDAEGRELDRTVVCGFLCGAPAGRVLEPLQPGGEE